MLQKGGMLQSVIAARLPNKIEPVRRVLECDTAPTLFGMADDFQRTRREEIKVV
jgi:hypothetical protein